MPYQVFGERAGALALMIAWSRLALSRSVAGSAAILASTSLSPSPFCAATFISWTRSCIAAFSSAVNPSYLFLVAVILADFCLAFTGGFLPESNLMGTTLMLGGRRCGCFFISDRFRRRPADGRLRTIGCGFHGYPRPRKAAQGEGPYGSRVRPAARRAGRCAIGRDVDGTLLPQLQGGVRRGPVQLPHDPQDRAGQSAAEARRHVCHGRLLRRRLYVA